MASGVPAANVPVCKEKKVVPALFSYAEKIEPTVMKFQNTGSVAPLATNLLLELVIATSACSNIDGNSFEIRKPGASAVASLRFIDYSGFATILQRER